METTVHIGFYETRFKCKSAPENLRLIGFLPTNHAMLFSEIYPVDVSNCQLLQDLAPILVQKNYDIFLYQDHDYILRITTHHGKFVYFFGRPQNSIFTKDSTLIYYKNFTSLFKNIS